MFPPLTLRAKALHTRYSKRAQPFGLTLEELDYKHFPLHNGYPRIPVRAWLRFPITFNVAPPSTKPTGGLLENRRPHPGSGTRGPMAH